MKPGAGGGTAREGLRRLAFARRGPAAFRPGTRVGGYRIEAVIGRGAHSIVHRARDEALGREVALKLVPCGGEDSAGAARREREARLLARLDHPGIVRVHAAGSVPGYRWVAMELVEGETLRAWISRGAASARADALALLRDLADALGAAHAAGVVHRDVKPENVLVRPDGRPCLLDFGIARALEPGGTGGTRGFQGTPRYAAPEQCRGSPATPASDVFSAGAVAFELLTGRPPFRGRGPAELVEAISAGEVRWPAGARVPRDLRAIVERCLEPDPRRRYRDGSELRDELAHLLAGEPVRARPRGLLSRVARRAVRLTRARPLAAAAALLGLALPAALLSWRALEARRGLEQRGAEERLDAARADFSLRRVDGAETALAALVGEGAPVRSRGLLADLRWLRGEREPARALYAEVLAAGEGRLADRMALEALACPDEIGTCARHADGLPRAEELADLRDLDALHRLHRHRGDLPAALAALDRVLELYPGDARLRAERAVLRRKLGRPEDALTDLLAVHHTLPADAQISAQLADALGELGRIAEAEEVLAEAQSRSPEHVDLLLARVMLSLRAKRAGEALPMAERALELAPDEPGARYQHALCLRDLGRGEEARAALEALSEDCPGHYEALLMLGLLEADLGRIADAERRAQALSEFGPLEAPRGEGMIRARIAAVSGDLDGFVRAYEELGSAEPSAVFFPLEIGKVLFEHGRFDEAAEAAERALALEPSCWEAWICLGRAREGAGRIDAARLAYERALFDEEKKPRTLALIASTWLRAGSAEHALPYLEEALRIDPREEVALRMSATAFNMLRRHADTLAAAEALLEVAPSAEAYDLCACALFGLARYAEMRERLEQGLALEPRPAERARLLYSRAMLRLHAKDASFLDAAGALADLEAAAAHLGHLPEVAAALQAARNLALETAAADGGAD